MTGSYGHHSPHLLSKQSLVTLVVGLTCGFSFAYMMLNSAAGRREIFLGPPYPRDVRPMLPADPHSHEPALSPPPEPQAGVQKVKEPGSLVFRTLESRE